MRPVLRVDGTAAGASETLILHALWREISPFKEYRLYKSTGWWWLFPSVHYPFCTTLMAVPTLNVPLSPSSSSGLNSGLLQLSYIELKSCFFSTVKAIFVVVAMELARLGIRTYDIRPHRSGNCSVNKHTWPPRPHFSAFKAASWNYFQKISLLAEILKHERET